MHDALYGPSGIYRTGGGAQAHFRTSVHVSTQFADALARLVVAIDHDLGHPTVFDLVDLGADRGQLLDGITSSPVLTDDLRARLRPIAVEVAPAPLDPTGAIWVRAVPSAVHGMVIANELLDNIPVDVVQVDDDRHPRQVLVAASGQQALGAVPPPADLDWIARWWPLDEAEPGDRAEVGRLRDEMWAEVVSSVRQGVALAIDYAHVTSDRLARRYAHGTLTGFRRGHQVPPVPDGSCDLTAHVALDACGTAAEATGDVASVVTTQREALSVLGVDASAPRTGGLAAGELVARLVTAGEAHELLDPMGLGAFSWLVQARGAPLPRPFRAAAPSPPGW